MRVAVEREEKINVELRAAVASLEVMGDAAAASGNTNGGAPSEETTSRLATATQKVVYLQQQNDALHKALKQAKEVRK